MKFDFVTIKALGAEFVCSFIFIFTIGANALNEPHLYPALRKAMAGISTAFVAVAIIYAFGELSGAHFNPAVTVGAMVGGKIDLIKGILYIGLQLLAGVVGVGVLSFLFSDKNAAEKLLLSPKDDFPHIRAILMEAILTFILIIVIYGTVMGINTTIDPSDVEAQGEKSAMIASNKQRTNFAPIAIGLTLGFLCFLGGTVSGGAFNPMIATAPALVTLSFRDLWIYWIGDLAGGTAAALLYHFFFAK